MRIFTKTNGKQNAIVLTNRLLQKQNSKKAHFYENQWKTEIQKNAHFYENQ